MAKQLLHKKNVDKLTQLDSGFFTYLVDGYKVDVFVSKDKLEGRGLDDFYSKDYTEYSVYINYKQVFYKKKVIKVEDIIHLIKKYLIMVIIIYHLI